MLSTYRDHLEPISTVFQRKPQEDVEIEFHTSEGDLIRFESQVSNNTKRGISFNLSGAGIAAAELAPGQQVFIVLVREDALYGFEAKIQRLTKYPLLVVNTPETTIQLTFVIPSPLVRIVVEGAVLRVLDQEDPLQLVTFYPKVPEKTRDAIMQYLMTEQRALLRGERMP